MIIVNSNSYGQGIATPIHWQTAHVINRPVYADTFKNNRFVFIPADYNAKHHGFFCKEEIKMEQAHIPVKLRLGSLEYCNWLEQKPGYRTTGTPPY